MKILIIEDEQAAIRRLRKLLPEIRQDCEVLDALSSIEASVAWLASHASPDVILMDIHLADGSSFEIFNKLEVRAPIVFVTAYDEYALKAFRVNAIDYLLKPIKKEELAAALKKVADGQMAHEPPEVLMEKLTEAGFLKPTKRILVKMGQSLKMIDLNEVAYYYSRDKISFAVLPENKRYPLDFSLDLVETFYNRLILFGGEYPGAVEHGRVRLGTADILAVKSTVEVFRGGEALHESCGVLGETPGPDMGRVFIAHGAISC